jgi:uncharacterized membrane protein YphA (DoxX/SURF4 family)
MFEKKVLNVYSVIIGVFFLISGLGKVINTAAFSTLIYQYGLGYLMILSPLIVIVEILLGLYLLFLINPRRYSLIAFIMLVIFTISFAYAHFSKGINDCGCFGTLKHSNFPPVFTFLRNFILLIMSFIILIKYPKEKQEIAKWKKYLILAFMCISIFISGFTFKTPPFLKKQSEKHPFQSQNIKNTALSKYIKTSPDSTYLVFCFSYTCPHCWNSIENLRQFIKSKTVDSVFAIATGDPKDKLFFEENFRPDFKIKDIHLDAMSELTDGVPNTFYIKNDTIKVVLKSVLPSHITFKKQYILP